MLKNLMPMYADDDNIQGLFPARLSGSEDEDEYSDGGDDDEDDVGDDDDNMHGLFLARCLIGEQQNL